MEKWISLDEKKPRCCETIAFSDGKSIFFGWLETYEFGEDLVFYAFADIRGKTGSKIDYWPEGIEWWISLPKLPKGGK